MERRGQQYVVFDDHYIRRAIRKISRKDHRWMGILRSSTVQDVIAHDEEILERVVASGAALRAKHNERIWRSLLRDPALLDIITTDELIVEHVLASQLAAQIREDQGKRERLGIQKQARSWFADRELLDTIPLEAAIAHWGLDTLIQAIGIQRILDQLPAEKRLVGISPSYLLRDLPPDRVLEFLRPESVINHVQPHRLAQFLGADVVIELQEPDQWLTFLGAERLMRYVTADRILASDGGKHLLTTVGMEGAVRHFGAEALLRHIGPELAVRTYGAAALLERINDREIMARINPKRYIAFHGLGAILDELPDNDRTLPEAIIARPKLLDIVLNDERTIRHIVSNHKLRQRIGIFDTRRMADQLSYALPAAVVSFPRSGSNFLQSQLTRHTCFSNVSLYGPLPEPEATVLTVKSHAPNPEYLRDEFSRRLAGRSFPNRIILLWRDPRDVMISFYEYTQHVRSTSIAQEEFLNSDYFYASGIDRGAERRVHPEPLTICAAFREFVREWSGSIPEGYKVLQIRYEDLLNDSKNAFTSVFSFLEIDARPGDIDLSAKVSLYDHSREQRGVTAAWEFYGKRYRVLIDDVSNRLALELRAWGYAPSPAEATLEGAAEAAK